MAQITLRLGEDLLDELDAEADEHGVSRSEHIRDTLASRHEHEPNTDELQRVRAEYEDRIAGLEAELERAKRERRQLLEQREEHSDLVAVVEREQSLAERRARAGWWTKLKWSALGMPDDGD